MARVAEVHATSILDGRVQQFLRDAVARARRGVMHRRAPDGNYHEVHTREVRDEAKATTQIVARQRPRELHHPTLAARSQRPVQEHRKSAIGGGVHEQ
jgi:hypothetical protein